MKRMLCLFLSLFVVIYSAESKFVISGNIKTFDGFTPKMAHVGYLNSEGKVVIQQTDENGYFKIEFNSQLYSFITCMAVDHQSTTQKFVIPTDVDSINITTKLMPNQIYNDLSKIYIIGNFNDMDFENAPEMTKQPDGTYIFEIDTKSDTLSYQIFPQYTKSLADRTFNGSSSTTYEYDNNGDYFSVLIDKSRKFKVILNPEYFPKGTFISELEIDNEKYSSEFNSYKNASKDYNQYVGERSTAMLDNNLQSDAKNNLIAKLKMDYMKRIEERLAQIQDKNFRSLTILEYLNVAHDGINVNDIEHSVNQKLISELFEVSPESVLWDGQSVYFNLAFAEILLGNIGNPTYLYKVLNAKHPDNVKAGLLSVLVHYCHYNNLDDLKEKYYSKLQKEFPETKEAFNAKISFSNDRNILVGKKIPDFSLRNLDDENEIISPASLKGKFVLVDVWGTWCMPCLMELPNLIKAYEKFKDKNFTIFSVAIDASADVVKQFRKSKIKLPWLSKEEQVETNLPWLHTYAGNWESDIIKTFEIAGVPTTFLIDPKGTIISIDNLKGDLLIKTLEKYIK